MKRSRIFITATFILSFLYLNLIAQNNSYIKDKTPITNVACSGMGVENGWNSWTARSGTNNSGVITFGSPGSPVAPGFNLTSGIGIDSCTPGTLPGSPVIPVVSPRFGNASIQLGQLRTNGSSGSCSGGCVEQLTFPLTVTAQDTNFTFSYAMVMEDGGHSLADHPFVSICIIEMNLDTIPCGYYKYKAGPTVPGCYQSTCNVNSVAYYKPWTTVGVNLSYYIGQTLNIVITNADCGLGDHFTQSYWDFSCGNPAFEPEYCTGQQLTLCAPFDTTISYIYQWSYNGDLIPGGMTRCISVYPQLGDTFSVFVQQPSGCYFTLIYMPKEGNCTNLLSGSVFSDVNANCIMDIGDNSIQNRIVKAYDTSTYIIYYGSTYSGGIYNMWLPTGTYSLSCMPKPYWNQICPSSLGGYSATVGSYDTIGNLNFGMQPSVNCPDLTISIGSSILRRCMFNNFYVQYCNDGTIPATNTLLKIKFDDPLGRIIPQSSTLPWDSVSGTSYFWHFDTVAVGQCVSFNMVNYLNCSAQVGNSISVSAYIYPLAGDCNIENNHDEDLHTVIGSYDPNEKLASTSSNILYTSNANILSSDTIDFIIRFQNTGNDTAFTVVLYDTLDADLDIPSVVSGVGSHPYTFELFGTGILKWTFNNILLPDSNVNELASHGFVKFQILQKPNNPVGTVIKNSVGIVFDFNAPVLTDTVVLTVIDNTGIHDGNEEVGESIRIFPNPSSGKFSIQMEKGVINSVQVSDLLGQTIYRNTLSCSMCEVDISDQPRGIYFLQIVTANGTVAKKIVKQ